MKFLLVFLLSFSTLAAHAQWHPHTYGYRGYGYRGWVAPAVVGGVIGYEIARQPQVIIQQQPVIVQQPAYAMPGTNCTPWQVVQMPDGTYVQSRTCQ
jgi:hypothetical protein